MARTIEITCPEGSNDAERARNLHRFRNFAEELSFSLGDLGELPMDEADRAITKVVVSKIAKRDVGKSRQLIERLLRKHLMAHETTIGRPS